MEDGTQVVGRRRTTEQTIQMLREVLDGEPYSAVSARRGISRSAVERRVKALAVQITKALMRDPGRLAARMAEEGVHFAAQLKSPEAKEAFAAFAEKRAPDFSKVA